MPAGSSLAIVGETGSGKTTLSYLVPRRYDVTGGQVRIDGVDVRDLSFDTLAAAVGVVSREGYLLHASIADNLRYAKPGASSEELVAAAKAAQIHDLIDGQPAGYDTIVGERGYRFSGGQEQRLALARGAVLQRSALCHGDYGLRPADDARQSWSHGRGLRGKAHGWCGQRRVARRRHR